MHYRTLFMFMPNPNRIRVYVVAWPNQPRPHTMQTSWLSINLIFLTEEVRFLLLTGEQGTIKTTEFCSCSWLF